MGGFKGFTVEPSRNDSGANFQRNDSDSALKVRVTGRKSYGPKVRVRAGPNRPEKGPEWDLGASAENPPPKAFLNPANTYTIFWRPLRDNDYRSRDKPGPAPGTHGTNTVELNRKRAGLFLGRVPVRNGRNTGGFSGFGGGGGSKVQFWGHLFCLCAFSGLDPNFREVLQELFQSQGWLGDFLILGGEKNR